jgi:general L-amino acid transport system permease protein
MARSTYEQSIAQGVPPKRQSWFGLLRRFWPIIAVFIFFASFAKNLSPMILVVTAVLVAVGTRWVGWAAPAALRLRAGFITALLFVAAMLVVAGTSKFGGLVVGLLLFAWAFVEVRRGDPATSVVQHVVRWVIPLAVAVVAYVVIASLGFDGYGWKDWGGFHVSVFTAVAGIGLGLPGGVLLALGRRSELPVVKTASVIFIEFVRGVPLISLLIFSIVFLPLFLPPSWDTPASLTLAIVVIGGFSAAYIAEIVRGGLQAVALGQTEAAQALGLSPGAMQRLIILPQALRAVIPAMVGQFISLFKDTSLLFAAGVLEFLGASTIANNQPQFLGRGLAPVTLLFVAIGYWAFSYTMSRESRLLERRLNTSR